MSKENLIKHNTVKNLIETNKKSCINNIMKLPYFYSITLPTNKIRLRFNGFGISIKNKYRLKLYCNDECIANIGIQKVLNRIKFLIEYENLIK